MTTRSAKNPVKKVPLLDVNRANEPIRAEMQDALARVLESGRFLHGPDVSQLEKSVATLCRVDHAVGCASGSDALLLSLMAMQIGPGDEVIVPSFTFFATASAVWRLGARIVFADIEPQTFNLDPKHVERVVTADTKAIIPVHLFGQCVEMDVLCELARRYGIRVVEDAAQAIGAEYLGRPAGAWGDVGCFSFYPTKNLGGCGDGGMLTTNDVTLNEQLRMMAAHGMSHRYYHKVVGINSRLDTFQAAALNVKLQRFDAWTAQRQANALQYEEMFTEAGMDRVMGLPRVAPNRNHVWNQYTIRVPGGRRDALRENLSERGIGTEIYYPHPLHQQACFASLDYGLGSLPETEKAASEVLSLPIFPGLTVDEQRYVVQCTREFFAHRHASAA
ncbi:MAG: DegT/DnrJ/EryC1/StrS family aminotransferase [Pirellulaceae bacterium]